MLLAVTTLAFDIAGLELFLPLITGARIELVSRETVLDGVALGRASRHLGRDGHAGDAGDLADVV